MKKRIIAMLLAMGMSFAIAGCGEHKKLRKVLRVIQKLMIRKNIRKLRLLLLLMKQRRQPKKKKILMLM